MLIPTCFSFLNEIIPSCRVPCVNRDAWSDLIFSMVATKCKKNCGFCYSLSVMLGGFLLLHEGAGGAVSFSNIEKFM